MAIDFPNAPTIGQSFTSGNQTWVWDGVAWAVTDSPVPNAADYVLRAGDVMTGQLQVPSLLVNVDASVAGKLILAGDPTQPLQAATKAYVDAVRTDADGAYLKLTGGTITGSFTIAHGAPGVNLVETDMIVDQKRWRIIASNAMLTLAPRTDADGQLLGGLVLYRNTLGTTDARLTGAPLIAPVADSIMTLDRSDARFTRYRDDWVNGPYPQWSIVNHHGGTWIATVATSQEPGPAATQWDALGGASGAYVGATPPTNPVAGQLWYCTVAPVGLFVWFVDVDSGQWVSTDGSGGISQESADGRYLKLVGGTLTGDLWISSALPRLDMQETDQAASMKNWVMFVSGGQLQIQPRADDGTQPANTASLWLSRDATGLTDIRWSGAPALSPSTTSLLNRTHGDARYLQLAGGTLTGQINLQRPTNTSFNNSIYFKDASPGFTRWALVHANTVDGDFRIQRHDTAGTYLNSPLLFPAVGGMQINGYTTLKHDKDGSTTLAFFKFATGNESALAFSTSNDVRRWQLTHTADGTNAFLLRRYDAAGVMVDEPIYVTYSGNINLTGGLYVRAQTDSSLSLMSLRRFDSTTAGSLYWDNTADNIELRKYDAAGTSTLAQLRLSATDAIIGGSGITAVTPGPSSIITMQRGDARYLTATGGVVTSTLNFQRAIDTNYSQIIFKDASTAIRWSFVHGNTANGNFRLNRSDIAGAFQDTPISVSSSNAVVTFSQTIVNGPSDATLKANIAPLTGALAKVTALQGRVFNMLSTPDKLEIGLIAQEVEPIVPELIQHFDYQVTEDVAVPKLAVDYSRLTALLVEAIKELTLRVAQLETAVG